MTPSRFRAVGVIALTAFLVGQATSLRAQSVEVTPFGGYRFGGDFFELITGQSVDIDGAPAVGAIVDIPLREGLQLEALFTHQDATVTVATGPFGLPSRWNLTVDHFQVGGLQEYDYGPVRPFGIGTLGLTRYAGEGDSEMRFTLGAGGGVKLFPSSRIGVRLNGQVFATFIYADARVVDCGPGVCFVGINADIVWQMEFTAGLIFKIR
jgi:hypothetical protein